MAFAVKYRVEFTDRKQDDWRCDILEDGFVGSITTLRTWGSNPLRPRFRASSVKLKHSPICPTDVTLDVVSDTDYALLEFAYNTGKHYLMKLYSGTTTLMFEGYVLKGLGGENYTSPPYKVTIQATDGLAQLKDVPYTHIGGSDLVLGSAVLTHITNDLLEISKDFLDNSSLFPDSITPGANDTSLDSTFVNQELFVQEEMSTYEVLADLMTTHDCRFYQNSIYWIVENLESYVGAPSITAKRRDAITYAYVSDIINNTPISIHTDNIPIGGSSLSFIEAPKEIEVNTDLVLFDNILVNDGLDQWSTLIKWTELGGGTMAELSDGSGYAALNSWNNQTILGETHLGVGFGAMGGLYETGNIGETHDIISIVDLGGAILTLTFTNTFVGVAPTWVVGSRLYIEGRGVFSITANATVGAGGVSTMNISVAGKGEMTPKVRDRILGDINLLFGLEQEFGIPIIGFPKKLSKDSTKELELTVTYATQWVKASSYAIVADKGVHFIGVKTIKDSVAPVLTEDTFYNEEWVSSILANVLNKDTQLIELEETENEQFTTKTFQIPLDWTFSEDSFIRVALPGGYSKSVVYKSIKFRIRELEASTHTEANIADNNTSIILSGTLFKAQSSSVNTEYGAMGGLLDSFGDEHINFSTGQLKNDVIAELIKANYAENVQVWKGTLDGFVGANHTVKDPKNDNRFFQIQEVTNNLNVGTSAIMCAEISPEGLITVDTLQGETGTDTLQGATGSDTLRGQ